MGIADAIPGVSGGTIALILGIYPRLVTAISRFDLQLLRLIKNRQWKPALKQIDFRFLVALAIGIAIGIVTTVSTIAALIADPATRPLVYAAFFGMIVASTLLVARQIRCRDPGPVLLYVILGLVGTASATALVLISPAAGDPQPPYIFVFICGAVAICAMILPGISGAMVLLLLGIYSHLSQIPHRLMHGEQVIQSVVTTLVFGAGCAIGLISFSKILRWLLDRYHDPTLAVLCGLMVGSLLRLWPFQAASDAKEFQPEMPASLDSKTILVILIALAAGGIVWFASRWDRPKHPSID